MGNISRDTFDDLKRYVGVRLQQGVPLVDADWNELEDIRRFELRAYLKWFVGNGIPDGNNGFAIQAIPGEDNDFMIVGGDGTAEGAGRCLVEGLDVFNSDNLRHSDQLLVDPGKAAAMGVPQVQPLSTPGADIDYIIFLDVWEREIFPGEPGDDQDIFDRNLINETIGVPTCTRLKREWAVRMVDASLPFPTPSANHYFYPLAQLARRSGDASVNPEDIADLRRTGLIVPSRHDINQVTKDAFGNSYSLDGDGEPNLKLSLRQTINSLLRGEMPMTSIQALTPDTANNALPEAIMDNEGNTWWFWLSDRGGAALNFDLWYKRYDIRTATWGPETRLSTDASTGYRVSLMLHNTGNIWVFWDSTVSGNRDIWYDRYDFSTTSWDGNTQLTTSTTSDVYQAPVVDQAGNIWVFWESGEGGNDNIWYDRFDIGTSSWDGASQLTTDTGADQTPTVVIDQDNNIWVFWYAYRSSNYDIWYRRYTAATASWGTESQLTTDAGYDSYPIAVRGATGDIWLFWRSNRSGDYQLWYRHYRNGSWGSEYQLTTSNGSIEPYYRAVVDANNEPWVFWAVSVSGRQDIWYIHFSNGTWESPGKISHDMAETSNYLPSPITNAEGDIEVLWSSIGTGFTFKSWHRKIISSI